MTVVVEVASPQLTVETAASGQVTVSASTAAARVIEVGIGGPQGAQGAPGLAAFASADPNNRTVVGTDGGLYTPDITADPLAYYILAKA